MIDGLNGRYGASSDRAIADYNAPLWWRSAAFGFCRRGGVGGAVSAHLWSTTEPTRVIVYPMLGGAEPSSPAASGIRRRSGQRRRRYAGCPWVRFSPCRRVSRGDTPSWSAIDDRFPSRVVRPRGHVPALIGRMDIRFGDHASFIGRPSAWSAARSARSRTASGDADCAVRRWIGGMAIGAALGYGKLPWRMLAAVVRAFRRSDVAELDDAASSRRCCRSGPSSNDRHARARDARADRRDDARRDVVRRAVQPRARDVALVGVDDRHGERGGDGHGRNPRDAAAAPRVLARRRARRGAPVADGDRHRSSPAVRPLAEDLVDREGRARRSRPGQEPDPRRRAEDAGRGEDDRGKRRARAIRITTRIGELDQKTAAAAETKTQYQAARAALEDQQRYRENIRRGRERLVARMHNHVAALEKFQLAATGLENAVKVASKDSPDVTQLD